MTSCGYTLISHFEHRISAFDDVIPHRTLILSLHLSEFCFIFTFRNWVKRIKWAMQWLLQITQNGFNGANHFRSAAYSAHVFSITCMHTFQLTAWSMQFSKIVCINLWIISLPLLNFGFGNFHIRTQTYNLLQLQYTSKLLAHTISYVILKFCWNLCILKPNHMFDHER